MAFCDALNCAPHLDLAVCCTQDAGDGSHGAGPGEADLSTPHPVTVMWLTRENALCIHREGNAVLDMSAMVDLHTRTLLELAGDPEMAASLMAMEDA